MLWGFIRDEDNADGRGGELRGVGGRANGLTVYAHWCVYGSIQNVLGSGEMSHINCCWLLTPPPYGEAFFCFSTLLLC